MKLGTLPAFVLALFVLLTAIGAVSAAPPPLANSVIVIIRHAEKPDDGPGLTPTGQQRAGAYVHYFETFRIDSQLRRPNILFATANTRKSHRETLTIQPLSAAFHLPIDDRFKDDDIQPLLDALKSEPAGKTILICWHHGEIPDLLQALGADPNALLPGGTWPDDAYSWLIELRFDGRGHLVAGKTRRINLHLLPGDPG